MQNQASGTRVAFVRKGAVGEISLDRPGEDHKLDLQDIAALTRAIQELGADPEVRLIVLGRGSECFCSGRDSSATPAYGREDFGARVLGPITDLYTACNKAEVPLVACVRGQATGLGVAMAACCDLVLADAGARFSMPEIVHGVAPTTAMVALGRRLHYSGMALLVYTGEAVDAATAQRIGLADMVFPEADFVVRSEHVIDSLSQTPRIALQSVKRMQQERFDGASAAALSHAASLFLQARFDGCLSQPPFPMETRQ